MKQGLQGPRKREGVGRTRPRRYPSAEPIYVDQTVFCHTCGVMNTLARGYCRECGGNLTEPAAATPPATEARVRICSRCRRGNPEDATACSDCGAHFARPVARPVEPEVALDPLPCPGCGTEMEVGITFLDRGGFWKQVFSDSRDWLQLVFRRDESLRNERVVRPGEAVRAQRCPACNGVWIAPPPPRETGW